MTATPRHPNLIIDDLGFRSAWLEKTVQMNIERLQAMAARGGASADELRQAAVDLAIDTHKNLTELQVCAVERLLVQNRVPAEIIQFAKPAEAPVPEVMTS